SEEHTSELQSLTNLVCRLLLEKKKRSAGSPVRSAPSKERSATRSWSPPSSPRSGRGEGEMALADDDPRGLAAQHRDQAGRDGMDVLRAYHARASHQLEDARARAHREAHRAPDAAPRRTHDADVRGVEARAGQCCRDHDIDPFGVAQPDLPRSALEQELGLGRLAGAEIDEDIQAFETAGHRGGD